MRQVYGRNIPFLRTLILAWLILSSGGCSLLHRPRWQAPSLVLSDSRILRKEPTFRTGSRSLAKAEIAYAAATEAMEKGHASCVDEFFSAAQFAWDDVEHSTGEGYAFQCRASEIYRSSLNAIVTQGQKHRRLDARSGLHIHSSSGWSFIPIMHHGFPRSDSEFDELAVVGEYSVPQLNHTYRRNGVGVPVIAVRNRERSEPFQRRRQAFAATLVLRQTRSDDSSQNPRPILELYDPLRISSFVNRNSSVPLASDTTAPIARALSTVKRTYIQSFLQPGLVRPEDNGLFMLEPYQSGKIPVIFIHGLLSDRLTWSNLVNELNARPEFVDRYQLWGFEYPTGEPFLTSAKLLRHQLEQIRVHFDPRETDCAFKEIVLVGHSMGGLISKMQITESNVQVWNSISNRNFENVAMMPDTRKKFSEAAFFRPSPLVSRVIFVGTPHRGSALAQRAIGRVGSILIEEPAELKAEHGRLLDDNPGIFSREFSRRVPTSIDMLEPSSKLLQAIDRLPISPRVRTHSIIGQGRWMPGNGDSDGVVPVSSARHEQSATTEMVTEKHSKLTEDPKVIEQVLLILQEHHRQFATTAN